MDQYPFEFKLTVVGMDVEDFIVALELAGFDDQAEEVRKQFEEELKSW